MKPNDVRALELMDHAARDIMEEYPDIVLAFGESDEFRSVIMIMFLSCQKISGGGAFGQNLIAALLSTPSLSEAFWNCWVLEAGFLELLDYVQDLTFRPAFFYGNQQPSITDENQKSYLR